MGGGGVVVVGCLCVGGGWGMGEPLMSPAQFVVIFSVHRASSQPLPGLTLGKDGPKAVYLKAGQQLRHVLNLFSLIER